MTKHEFSQIVLQKIQVGMTRLMDKRLIEDASFDVVQWTEDLFEVSLRGYLYGEHISTLEVAYPATWWNHFKQDNFPKWLLKRHPVEKTVVVVEAKALYVELHNKISLPREPYIISLTKGHQE